MKEMKTVGDRINHIRKTLSLTMEEFGNKIDGSSRSLVHAWINNKYKPNKERLEKIARLGGVTVNWLLYGVDDFSEDIPVFSPFHIAYNNMENPLFYIPSNVYKGISNDNDTEDVFGIIGRKSLRNYQTKSFFIDFIEKKNNFNSLLEVMVGTELKDGTFSMDWDFSHDPYSIEFFKKINNVEYFNVSTDDIGLLGGFGGIWDSDSYNEQSGYSCYPTPLSPPSGCLIDFIYTSKHLEETNRILKTELFKKNRTQRIIPSRSTLKFKKKDILNRDRKTVLSIHTLNNIFDVGNSSIQFKIIEELLFLGISFKQSEKEKQKLINIINDTDFPTNSEDLYNSMNFKITAQETKDFLLFKQTKTAVSYKNIWEDTPNLQMGFIESILKPLYDNHSKK